MLSKAVSILSTVLIIFLFFFQTLGGICISTHPYIYSSFFIWKNKKISSIFPLVFFSLPFFSISPWRSAPALPSPPLHSLLITFLCWGPPRGKPASEVKMNGGKAKEWRIKYWQSEKWWVIKYDKHGQQKWWSLYLYVMKEPCISLYLSTSLFWELPREAPKAPGSLFGNWQFVVTVFLANLFGNMHHCTMSTEMVRELRGLLPSLVILRHCVGVGLFNAPVDIIFICGISPNSCMFNQNNLGKGNGVIGTHCSFLTCGTLAG